MAKQGMKRPERTHTKPENDAAAVPELQGKAKHTKEKARPIIAGTHAPAQKVYHVDKPISKEQALEEQQDAYAVLDTDLARDNLENDIPEADRQDL